MVGLLKIFVCKDFRSIYINLILGVDDFGKARTQKLLFVDKSLFIKELLDRSQVEAAVIDRLLKIGVGFRGKEVALASE